MKMFPVVQVSESDNSVLVSLHCLESDAIDTCNYLEEHTQGGVLGYRFEVGDRVEVDKPRVV